MNIKEILKSNKIIRRLGKKINTNLQFKQDAKDFNSFYLEEAKEKGDYKYAILLYVHSLEKGMCFDNPRPFGADKVKELIRLLSLFPEEQKCEFEYRIGVSILFAWRNYYEMRGWEDQTAYDEVSCFLSDKKEDIKLNTGFKYYSPKIDIDNYTNLIEKAFFSRHSVRSFKDKEIEQEDITFALKCFVETPTACNRQMCRVYYIQDKRVKKLLDETIVGISGVNKKTVHYFVITYDLAAFAYSGERQQGMFNAGLCTMNFINGLHAKGIGTCCLQWSNKNKQDRRVRTAMRLSESERIGIVIGAGYYLDNNRIPCSVRRKPEDIFKVI